MKNLLSKNIIIPALALTIVGGTLLGVGQIAHAQSNNPYSGLVQAIAQKFGLDQSKVQAVVDDYRQQRHTYMKQNMQQNMQQRLQSKLDAAVKAGKITSAQEKAILDEVATLKNKYNPDSLKNMTPAQRKQTLDQMRSELQSWAKSQGIDPSYVMMGRMGGRHGGWMHHTVSTSPTPTQ